MSQSIFQHLGGEIAEKLERSLNRLRQQLREAECSAPPPLFQMLEELRLIIAEDSDKARQRVQELLQSMGASEEEFLDWLRLDIELLEKKLLSAMSLAADPSQIDLAFWRQIDPEEKERSESV